MTNGSNDSVAPPPLPEVEVTGTKKIRAMLMERGLTISAWARLREVGPEEARMMTSGTRPYPALRDLLAVDLGISRDELDVIIDGPPPEGARESVA